MDTAWLIRNVVAAWLLPPGLVVLAGACGLALLGRRPRAGKCLVAGALAALYALSTQYVAHALLQTLEPAAAPRAGGVGEAIVVLGSGTYFQAPEYGADTVSAATLERLRYAAHLHRLTRKPLLAAGGRPEGGAAGEAVHMKTVLTRDFHVPVAWTEEKSRTTLENARLARELLGPAGAGTIFLVTHAWHMRRARMAFEHAGFTVIPAATGYATRQRLTALDFVPRARALRDSSRFFHEAIGIGWYRLQFAISK